VILLDTNVISALMRPTPDFAVLQWLDRQPAASIWTTTVTLLEIRYGLQSMPPGKKRDRMTVEFERKLAEDLQNRIAVFDLVAAEHAAELMAYRKRNGNQVEIRDCMIAGIALATRATIATRNVSHFSDLSTPVVNPWTD